MSVEIQPPPAGISPDEFFTQWLPAQVANIAVPTEGLPTIRSHITLTGDDGGSWTLLAENGQLNAEAGLAGQADLFVEQSTGDWRAFIAEDSDLALQDTAGLDKLLLDPSLHKLVTETKGKLRLEVTGFNDSNWSIELRLGDVQEPAATISIDAETYQKLKNKELAPPEAYFSGKIQISGDAGFAMQAAMSMMMP